MYDILELNTKLVSELREIAKGLDIKRIESFKKQDLIYKILDTQAVQDAEKRERKVAPKEQINEDKGILSAFRKKPQQPVTENFNAPNEDLNRNKRPRRERIEPIIKREKVESGKKKKPVQKNDGVQSRQDQIKAIIKGFNRYKAPVMEQ